MPLLNLIIHLYYHNQFYFMVNQNQNVDIPYKLIAGLTAMCSSAFSLTMNAPVQFVKIRLQCMNQMVTKGTLIEQYTGIINLIKTVYAKQGIKAFWKGNLTNILYKNCNHGVGFLFQDLYKNVLKKPKKGDASLNWMLNNLLSGVFVGFTTTSISYPLDYIRTRLINDLANPEKGLSKEFHGISDVFKKTWKSDGISGFYRGFIISNFSIILYRSIYFGLYDTIKFFLPQSLKFNFFFQFSLGFFVTTLSGMASYPIDTIRRRMMMRSISQIKYKGSIDCAKEIYKNGGIRPFFNGFFVQFISGIAGALALALYDQISSRGNKRQNQ